MRKSPAECGVDGVDGLVECTLEDLGGTCGVACRGEDGNGALGRVGVAGAEEVGVCGEECGDFAAVGFGGVDVQGGDECVGSGRGGGGEGTPEALVGGLGGLGDAEEGIIEGEGGLKFERCV